MQIAKDESQNVGDITFTVFNYAQVFSTCHNFRFKRLIHERWENRYLWVLGNNENDNTNV